MGNAQALTGDSKPSLGKLDMPTLNYTTTVPVAKTVGEIHKLLAAHGADAVATMYSEGLATGVSFRLTTAHGRRDFTLPVDVDAVQKLLSTQAKQQRVMSQAAFASREHAARVAWRVIKDWCEAQMATLDEVMLPFLHVSGELTLRDQYRMSEQRALELGEQ